MPTYVYACDACGQQFEKFQSFKEDALTTCICGQEGKVRRVFQPVGVVFKGSGWYITDSRKGETSASAKSDTGTNSSEAPKADAKTETKTEAKAETKVETSEKPSTSSEASKPATKSDT